MYTKSIVDTLVRSAIRDMLESHVELMRDEGYGRTSEIGDLTETIREITLEYAEDMMNEMKLDVINEIKQLKFTAKIEATLKFNE